jgi:hypothetical protein
LSEIRTMVTMIVDLYNHITLEEDNMIDVQDDESFKDFRDSLDDYMSFLSEHEVVFYSLTERKWKVS